MKVKLVFIAILMVSAVVMATPGQPHQFFGSVSINGAAAPDGTVVTAQINSVVVETNTTLNGHYGYNDSGLFMIEDPYNDRPGKTIFFFVNGVATGTGIPFVNGDSTLLDLGITVSQPPSAPPSGGGGGGGGGYSPPSTSSSSTTVVNDTETTVEQTETCTEKWVCSEWSWCEDGLKSRTCEDENGCNTDNNRPIESYPCTTVTTAAEPADAVSITGLLISNPTVSGGIIIVLLIIIYLVYTLLISKKRASKRR